MKTKILTIITLFLMVCGVFAQTDLNNYKYIIVPNKFDFLRDKDQYRLNSLAEFLFEKYGFDAIMEGGAYPEDLRMNRCLALRSDVLKESGMFKTKLKVELKDCNDQVVYTSGLGESREKEFDKAYNEALRKAFMYLKEQNYTYVPNTSITALVTSPSTPQKEVAKNEVSEEIKALKAEIENLKQEKEVKTTIKKQESLVVIPKPKEEVVPEKPLKKNINPVSPIKEKAPSNMLYAQPINNGFQLVDSSPKVVYRLMKTGLENTFLVEGKNAIVYKKGNDWVIEYYSGNNLKTEALNIKF